jgi:hypothetical protein
MSVGAAACVQNLAPCGAAWGRARRLHLQAARCLRGAPERSRCAALRSQLVHSRTFGSAAREGGVGVRMLVPLIDMLNHAGDEAQLLLGSPSTATDNVRRAAQALALAPHVR